MGYHQNSVNSFWQEKVPKAMLALVACRTLGTKAGVELFSFLDAASGSVDATLLKALQAEAFSQAKADESGVTEYEYLCRGHEETIFNCTRQKGKCPKQEDGKEWVTHLCMDDDLTIDDLRNLRTKQLNN